MERGIITQGVERCITMRPSEALVTEAYLRRTRHRLLFAVYAMQPDCRTDSCAARIADWLELNREAAPKWLGRLSVDVACIDAAPPDAYGEPRITVGTGVWLAPEPQLIG